MFVKFNTRDADSYRLFLKVKALPRYRIQGHTAEIPDEYAAHLGFSAPASPDAEYTPEPWLFDYQAGIARLAVRKRRYAVFAACGSGKTAIFLEFARHAANVLPPGKCVLIVSPLMVIGQTIAEARRFYGDRLPVVQVRAAGLQRFLDDPTAGRVGITNYEALVEGLRPGRLGAIIPDESSTLKSHYGAWGRRLVALGKGIEWKLCLTGTPAPNDRIEYATHAVFLDQYPTINAFLARFFVNRGQTDNRWELKPHALRPFYRELSHWCIFLSNPAVYGWRDNVDALPKINIHIHDVPLTGEQSALLGQVSGNLFGLPGGIGSRARVGQLAKGRYDGREVATNKPAFIRSLVDSWPEESTLIWCLYNREQESMEHTFPEAGSISGDTKEEERARLIGEFQRGERKVLISKAKVLGFGLNLQVATRQVFSGLQDSWELFHQAVKRSNRYGSTRPLNVHIPVTQLERPMVETVLRKAKRIDQDTTEQESLFKEMRLS